MSKPVILTGIRANTDLHIGNYLGALLPMVDMATKHAGDYQINLFLPDLHSFTTPVDHSKLFVQVMDNIKIFVAAGLPLDHPDVHLYRQSYIPAHSELTWILDCFTGFGEMSRMTQFKDKSRKLYSENSEIFNHEMAGEGNWNAMQTKKNNLLPKLEQRITLGLFNYPVLMASDILLYGATYVPVGDDQTQHLEFTRDIAERMNAKFGELFVVPKSVKEQHAFFGKDQGLRIRDLLDPTKKMSKSDETGKGVIFLTDAPDEARKKIMSATTDSSSHIGRGSDQPGITNLLDIYQFLSGKSSEVIIQEWYGEKRYGDFKAAVANVVAAFLEDFQNKLANIDERAIMQKLESSEAAMNEIANATLLKVQQAVGLRPKS